MEPRVFPCGCVADDEAFIADPNCAGPHEIQPGAWWYRSAAVEAPTASDWWGLPSSFPIPDE